MFALDRRDVERALRNAKPAAKPPQEIPTLKTIRRIFLQSAIPSECFGSKMSKSSSSAQIEAQKTRKTKVDWEEIRGGAMKNEGPKRGERMGEYKPPSYNNYFEYK